MDGTAGSARQRQHGKIVAMLKALAGIKAVWVAGSFCFGKQSSAFIRDCGRIENLRLLVFLLLLVNGQASADAESHGEYEVKAAFIHNFAQFVVWPPDEQDSSISMRLCILGADPFGNALNILSGKRVDDKAWDVRVISTAAEARDCRVLFIAASESRRLQQILAEFDSKAVLTVGDGEGFAERGVIINFYMENRKVRFEINLDAASRAGLKISSQLLKLARIVHTDGS